MEPPRTGASPLYSWIMRLRTLVASRILGHVRYLKPPPLLPSQNIPTIFPVRSTHSENFNIDQSTQRGFLQRSTPRNDSETPSHIAPVLDGPSHFQTGLFHFGLQRSLLSMSKGDVTRFRQKEIDSGQSLMSSRKSCNNESFRVNSLRRPIHTRIGVPRSYCPADIPRREP